MGVSGKDKRAYHLDQEDPELGIGSRHRLKETHAAARNSGGKGIFQ